MCSNLVNSAFVEPYTSILDYIPYYNFKRYKLQYLA